MFDSISYFDLQVNGAFGVDFNDDDLTEEAFERACRELASTGLVGMLPTIITDSIEAMTKRIAKIARFTQASEFLAKFIPGIHVEGPFLSNKQGFFGTHPREHISTASLEKTMQLIDAGAGLVRMMTLAPEVDRHSQVIQRLRQERILPFAGHTDASVDELSSAIEAGLVGFTHLGNGCGHQVDRQNNIMQRILAHRERLMVTLIVDGIHVPAWLLQSWLEIIGADHCIVISDSMNAAGMPSGQYSMGGQPILVDDSRRTSHRDHKYLAGSASNLVDMDLWAHVNLKLSIDDRNKIFCTNAKDLVASVR